MTHPRDDRISEPRCRVLVAVFAYNEGEKLRETLRAFPPAREHDILVMDDGSTDDVTAVAREFSVLYLRHSVNRGVGAALRTVIRYAEPKGYDVLVMIAGNGKMDPHDIPVLLKPMLEDGFDYVQGSRYLSGGRSENLPAFRRIMIPVVTRIVSWITSYEGTDLTCGLRAFRLDIIRHPQVDISQPWLDRYEMEYYILYYALTLGFRVGEVPATMKYPVEKKNYSKIQPLKGWWSMIRPWVFLKLGLKK